MPFDRTDLLRQAGYESGDIVPIATISPNAARAASTTSTSFTEALDLFRWRVQWNLLTPAGLQTVANFTLRVEPGTDETYSARAFNLTDKETVAALTDQTQPNNTATGWTDYTPTRTDSSIAIDFQHKTEPGTNSSQAREPYLQIGVRL